MGGKQLTVIGLAVPKAVSRTECAKGPDHTVRIAPVVPELLIPRSILVAPAFLAQAIDQIKQLLQEVVRQIRHR